MANKPLHGICVKQTVIINQIVGTQHEIFPGRLIKIVMVNLDSCVIKLYDHDTKRLGKDLFKCENHNIKEVDGNVWSVISQLKKGDNITVNLAISGSNRIKVNFCIKNICDIPSLGGGRYFALDLIDNNLNIETKSHIHHMYYFGEQSAYCIRGDKLVEGLIIYQPEAIMVLNSPIPDNYQISTQINLSTNHSVPRYISPYSANQIGFGGNNQLDQEVLNLKDGLENVGLNDGQNLHARNERIGVPAPNTRHFTPPSDENYQEHTSRNFRESSFASSNNVNRRQNPENKISNEKYQNYLGVPIHPSSNYSSQHTENSPVEGSYKPIESIIDQNFPDEGIRGNIGMSATHSYHFRPPSDENYQEHNLRDFRATPIPNNVPDAILRKMQLNTGNLKPFKLPTVEFEENIPNVYQNRFVEPQPSSNYQSQLIANSSVGIVRDPSSKSEREIPHRGPKNENITKQSKSRKKHHKHQNNDKTQCNNCRTLVDNIIELDCQHSLCQRCLVALYSNNLQDACCPFKKGNFKCNFKLDLDYIRDILNSIDDTWPGTINTDLGEAVLQHNDKVSNEVLLACKQDKCDGFWFVDETESTNLYRCPVCDKYNCFKCQVIHDGLTCEQYNQQNLAGLNNNSRLENSRIEKGARFEQYEIHNDKCTTDNTVAGNINRDLVSKPKPHTVQTRPIVNNVEEAEFEYNDGDSNELLFYCKNDRCEGAWFVDRTEGRNTYRCPICEQYNCIKCQVIHDGLTCEEYNQENLACPSNSSRLANNSRIEKGDHFKQQAGRKSGAIWECEYCNYNENLVITSICVVCLQANDRIKTIISN